MPALTVTINASTEHPLIDGSTISYDWASRSSRANLSYLENSSFAPAINHIVLVKDGGTTIFTGFIQDIRRNRDGLSPGTIRYEFVCQDYVAKMAQTKFTALYEGLTDRVILQTILSDTGLDSIISSPDASVDVIESGITIAFSQTTVRQAFEQIAEVSGAEWGLDGTAELLYNLPADVDAADFDLSDTPDLSATFPYSFLTVNEQGSGVVNDVTVLGSTATAPRPIGTAEDSTSDTAYGTRSLVIANELIPTDAFAQAIADAIIADRKDPALNGACTIFKDRVEVGQSIEVTSADYGLSAETFIIRAIALTQIDATQTRYDLTLGPPRGRAELLLKRFQAPKVIQPPVSIPVLEFDGANDHYLVEDVAALQDLAPISISLWFKISSFPGADMYLMRKGESTDAFGWELVITSTHKQIEFKVRRDSSDLEFAIDWTVHGALLVDRWYHLALVWDGSLATLNGSLMYLDGVEITDYVVDVGSGSRSADAGDDIFVGVGTPLVNEFYGQMAFVGLYERELTFGEVARHAASPGNSSEGDSCLFYHKFEDFPPGSSPTGADLIRDSCSTNDGTINAGGGNQDLLFERVVWQRVY